MNSAKTWCVYIIRTQNNRYYTGITNDIDQRWLNHQHDRRGAKFFRTSKPEAIVLLEASLNRSVASRREIEIKKLDRAQKERLIRTQGPYAPLPFR